MKDDTLNFANGVTILSDATGGQEEQDCQFYVNYLSYSVFLKASVSNILGLDFKLFD